MIFRCWINATYEIPDGEVRGVVEQLKRDWAGENVELFPNDLINTARNMGVGKLKFDQLDPEVETDEPVLSESEIPAEKAAPAKRKGRR